MKVSDLFGRAGIKFSANTMDNGESRFRMMAQDGSGYIRTVAGANGAWQNAHYHVGVMETYVIQTGWMGLVSSEQLSNGTMNMRVKVYLPGKVVTTRPRLEHNVYMPQGAVIHTVKHGVEVQNPEKGADWYPAGKIFNAWSKGLSEADLHELNGQLLHKEL